MKEMNMILLKMTLLFAGFMSACFAVSSAMLCERTLTTSILCPSEDCDQLVHGSYVNLVYTKAEGLGSINNTIHYLYSTWGIPSILVARTSRTAVLHINYTKFIDESALKSISFGHGAVEEVSVIMLKQLMDYRDILDTTNLEEQNYTIHSYDLSKAVWERATVTNNSEHHIVVFTMSENSHSPPLEVNGSIALRFQAFCSADYNHDLPNLQYNSNNSLVDVVLDRVKTKYPESRFALNLVHASNKHMNQNMAVEVERSIDDEHSPGSFLTINWLNGMNHSTSSSFVQWKPACFNAPVRSMQNSLSLVRYYQSKRYNFTSPQHGLAFNYFGDNLTDLVNVFALSVSFGLSKDKFYNNTAYIVWSFSVGLGVPPSSNGISLMIILILAVGLGIPVVLLLAGLIYRCVRKYSRHYGYTDISESYSEIN